MPSLQQLKSRIRSIQDTGQLTKAMQTVAAVRYKKNLIKATSANKYLNSLDQIHEIFLSNLVEKINSKFYSQGPDSKSIQDGDTISIIIGTTKGFCGGLNRSIFLKTVGNSAKCGVDIFQHPKNQVITVNKTAYKQAVSFGVNLQAAFMDLPKNPLLFDFLPLTSLVYDQFLNTNVKKVFISYLDMISGQVCTKQLLPFSIPKSINPENSEQTSNSKNKTNNSSFEIDSNYSKLFDEINHQKLDASIYSFYCQTMAGEEKARMLSMNQASDNAKGILKSVKLSYFRQRQGKITQEMNEIGGGLDI